MDNKPEGTKLGWRVVSSTRPLARSGQMPESESVRSLLLCEPLLRERGFLDTGRS